MSGDLSTTCTHENVNFIEEDNDFVCLSCGQVLQDFAFMDRESTSILSHAVQPQKWVQIASDDTLPTPLSMYATSHTLGGKGEKYKKGDSWDFDILERVCGNFFIPRCVEDHVVHLLSKEEYLNKRNGRLEKDSALIAFALYSSCLVKDCVKSADVIASWFQISEKTFWSIAKEFSYSARKVLPSDILQMRKAEIELMCEMLYNTTMKLPRPRGSRGTYSILRYISEVSDGLSEKLTHSPSVILASVLYMYLNLYRERIVSVREVAKLCGVSITSLNQLKKLLKSMDIFKEKQVSEKKESTINYYYEIE